MPQKKKLAYIFLFIGFVLNTLGQEKQIKFEHFGVAEGLSQSKINCIIQDKLGFLWIGTEDGLNRYDGYAFETYKPDPDNPFSISNNTIYNLFEDNQGRIWISTNGGGANYYDPNTAKFHVFKNNPDDDKSLSNSIVAAITQDTTGYIWIGTYGGGLNKLIDIKKGHFKHFKADTSRKESLLHNNIFSVIQDSYGDIWIGTDEGLSRLIDENFPNGIFKSYTTFPIDVSGNKISTVWTLIEDSHRQLWLGTLGGGLYYYDRQNDNLKYLSAQATGLSNENIYSIYEDSNFDFWIGTFSGLNKFDFKTNRFNTFINDKSDPSSLSNNNVWSIYEDRSGAFWVGTDNGLNKYNRKNQFRHYEAEPGVDSTLQNPVINTMYEDKHGRIIFGTDKGYDIFYPDKNYFEHHESDLLDENTIIHNSINAICHDTLDYYWFGTWGGGISIYNPKDKSFSSFVHHKENIYSLTGNYISEIFEDSKARVWVATLDGLNLFNEDNNTFINYRNDTTGIFSKLDIFIGKIFEDSKHKLWLCTRNKGLIEFDPNNGKLIKYVNKPGDNSSLIDNRILTIYESIDGFLWIGTANGLEMFDRKNKTFTHFTAKDGLPNQMIYGVLEDAKQNLWISTNRGLVKFNRKRNSFRIFGLSDGIQDLEFKTDAALKSQNGQMYFGGINGFNMFYPDSIKDNIKPPEVRITNFKVFNKTVPVGKMSDGRTIIEKPISIANEIHLSYKDYVISFEFSALHFVSPEKNLFAYKMENFDKDWTYTDANKRYATYTNLSGGEYIFKVKAANCDGIWNDEIAEIKILVSPPYYKTWWFRFLIIGVVIGAISLWYRQRIQRIEKQKKRELEWEVKERTAEMLEQKAKKVVREAGKRFSKGGNINQIAIDDKDEKKTQHPIKSSENENVKVDLRKVGISDYHIDKLLHKGLRSVIYHALRVKDDMPVIIKTNNSEYPSQREVLRLKREFQIIKNNQSEGIIKAYSLEKLNNSLAIIFEDFGGEGLNKILSTSKLEISEFLALAIRICKIIDKIHAKSIIHRNINPSNILWNPLTDVIKLIDYSQATALSHETAAVLPPNLMDSSLAYISPEQTGRMNRSMDYRSDFYSMGVTFYEMLLGFLPFQASDALELVHCHIAKEPIPPRQLNKNIPKAVSDLIMKLLAKTPEDRYQSAKGIIADLQFCKQQYDETGNIVSFEIGQKDVYAKFQIPQKLYGREKETKELFDAFERVCKGTTEMSLISGYSGIGKSVLVNEIYKPIVKERAFFVSGVYDQFQRDVPYSAFFDVFKKIIGQLLTEGTEELKIWKTRLLDSLGSNGKIIVDIIPELELIIGKQPDVPELSPNESQNRFHLVFRNFAKTFADKTHPLVFFLDNLQWADLSSLKLLEYLIVGDAIKYMFVIGAYREEEVNETHPLMMMIDEIELYEINVNNLVLQPLKTEHITQLLSETLKQTKEDTLGLAKLCLNKTNGNPFFLRQFILSLYKDKYFIYDEENQMWNWDINEIQKTKITDNVVNLMIRNIKKLPVETQDVLKLATCIGNPFDLKTLSIVNETSVEQTSSQLWPALEERLVIPLDDSYKFIPGTEELVEPENYPSLTSYKFLHDRVQQAAYSIIEENKKASIHLKIGRLLLKNTINKDLSDNIFEITNQLNKSLHLINEPFERLQLAELNFKVGKKSKASAGYESAFKNFDIAAGLLGRNAWKENYKPALRIYEEAAETAYLNGDFEQMERLIEIILNSANNLLDKVKSFEVKIQAYIAQNKLLKASKTAIELLQMLGIKLPEKPNKLNATVAFLETKFMIRGRKILDLINLDQMKEPVNKAAMRIMSVVFWAFYSSMPELFPFLVFKMVNLSVKSGNSPESALGYAGYGLYMCGVSGDIDTGHQFGKLALKLLEKFNLNRTKVRTKLIVNTFIIHWREHPKRSQKHLLDGYKSALDSGDFEYAGLFAQAYCFRAFLTGKNLVVLEKEMETYNNAIKSFRQEKILNWQAMYWQVCLNLLGVEEIPWQITGKVYDEEKMYPVLIAANDRTAIFELYIQKAYLCYLFEENKSALKYIDYAKKYLDGVTSRLSMTLFYYFDALIRISLYETTSKQDQKDIIKTVLANIETLKKWAKHSPKHFTHRHCLVEAELSKVTGKDLQTMEYYDLAINHAADNEFVQDEALANELAAKFFYNKGRTKVARNYMREAHYRYTGWGAIAKLQHLEQNYSHLLPKTALKKADSQTGEYASDSSEMLDFNSFMKVSQMLSGEVVFERLVKKMIEIVIENAGAQKGYLILERKAALYIHAVADAESLNVRFLKSQLLFNCYNDNKSLTISANIVNFVARSKEAVVLDNACEEGQFASDPFLQEHKILSVLCMPLLNKGKLTGIIYLENNLAMAAFTDERVKVLKLLSTQMAISLENATLYVHLEEEIQYLKSGLKKNDSKKYMDKIMNYMKREKPYLEPKLTLKQLADAFDVSTNYLSQLINENTEQNFSDFVNTYRVNEVKDKLKNPKYKRFTILAIAYECGFNSKSSFNSVFKKITGQTPRQYLKSIEEDED